MKILLRALRVSLPEFPRAIPFNVCSCVPRVYILLSTLVQHLRRHGEAGEFQKQRENSDGMVSWIAAAVCHRGSTFPAPCEFWLYFVVLVRVRVCGSVTSSVCLIVPLLFFSVSVCVCVPVRLPVRNSWGEGGWVCPIARKELQYTTGKELRSFGYQVCAFGLRVPGLALPACLCACVQWCVSLCFQKATKNTSGTRRRAQAHLAHSRSDDELHLSRMRLSDGGCLSTGHKCGCVAPQ